MAFTRDSAMIGGMYSQVIIKAEETRFLNLSKKQASESLSELELTHLKRLAAKFALTSQTAATLQEGREGQAQA